MERLFISKFSLFIICSQRAVTMIPAHDNPLAAIAFNGQGTKIATASEKVSTDQSIFVFYLRNRSAIAVNC